MLWRFGLMTFEKMLQLDYGLGHVFFIRFLAMANAPVAKTMSATSAGNVGNSGIATLMVLETSLWSIKFDGSPAGGLSASSVSNSSVERPKSVTLNVKLAIMPLPLKP